MNRLLSLALVSLIASSASAANYEIDADHSSVGFKIKHLAISSVTGEFSDVKGSFTFDPANPSAAKATATISAKSINTRQAKRDDHLRGADFFEADKFSEITFVSKEIKDATKDGFKVLGDLTIRGVTKPVTLDVAVGGMAKDPWGNERAAFNATAKINRKDFGLVWNKVIETGALVVGDDVTITLEVEGIKKS